MRLRPARLGTEDYVSPVTRAGEPRPGWVAVWPFRLVVAVAVLLLASGLYLLVFQLHLTGGGNAQG
jgi:hypothetical protein